MTTNLEDIVAGKQVDVKSKELMQDFSQHYQEFIETYPDKTDKYIVFQGWAVQKIAGLQLVVMELAERLDAVEGSKG
ncbi:MAG: hypothetical protein GY832_23470 [Chloroflexi bacterium]|nr:hypothetical protein [Chloroflexota bacterium]